MNRITEMFETLKKHNQKAFIGFLTAGDPDLETCKKLILELDQNGCDLIELGVPFSDPIAEGPVIQEANLRALAKDISTKKTIQLVKEVRQLINTPLVFLLYYNQVFKYGIEKFMQEVSEAGLDGLIIPDLPYEHHAEVKPIASKYGVEIISLITPVSQGRKEMVAKESSGFLYCVTSTGVTGVRSSFKADLKAFIEELRQYTDTPKALGFGIGTPEQVTEMKEYADGVIVGSAIVKEIAKITTENNTVENVGKFVKSLADACHQ